MGLIIFISLYVVLILVLCFGFARLEDVTDNKPTIIHSISIIIAARNEENLHELFSNLSQIKYSSFEIIVVDDHSDIPVPPSPGIKILRSDLPGKKAAITKGIQYATGDIIVTTDADCRVDPLWLHEINKAFQKPGVKMVVGGVRIQEDTTFFSKLQALEFVSVAATGAATLGLGFPTMCNGANLAYRKSAFIEVNGFEGNEKVSSGDDEFLMNKFNKLFSTGSIRYLLSKQSLVTTSPPHHLTTFLMQRLRWAGKWSVNTSFATRIFAVAIFLFQLSFIALIMGALMGSRISLWLLLARAFVEAIFLIPASNFFGVRWRWIPFLVLQLVYPLYVIGVGLSSQVVLPKWKGRVVERKV